MIKQFPLEKISIEKLFFSTEKNTYEIPIYQRNYAWEKDEIEALIRDIYDVYNAKTDRPYYIGTLVSYPKGDNIYEVIDGQQRLTTLRLILGALKELIKELIKEPSEGLNKKLNKESEKLSKGPSNQLTYRARKKSDATIKTIPKFVRDENHEIDNGIVQGYKYTEAALNELGIVHDAEFIEFIKYFMKKVFIIHYKVPKDTDLNHYFEIMNSRGEQLEKHEIVKANLIKNLDNDEDRKLFNIIWQCCSNMSVYVQQSIDGLNPEDIFGDDLHTFNVDSFEKILESYRPNACGNKRTEIKDLSIRKLIDPEKNSLWTDLKSEIEKKYSFQPIIDFPNFLLTVLKITRMSDDNFSPNDFKLDDKELLNEFKTAHMKEKQVKKFAFSLLKARFLLDNYIIHHSKEDDNRDSNPWKLQVWHKEKKDSYPYPRNLDSENSQDTLIHLLSMFEVSFTAKQRKNYLFYCLLYLMNNNDNIPAISDYSKFVEKLAEIFFKCIYLDARNLNEINTPMPGSFDKNILKNDRSQKNDLFIDESDIPRRTAYDFDQIYGDGSVKSKGVQLFIFNYLDYCLWRSYHERKKSSQEFFEELGCSDFGLEIFEHFYFSRTRNSLEHYYPQAMATDNNDSLDQDKINCFGNYAMIGSEANSSGSNWDPKTKLDHYLLDTSGKINQVSISSLKFRIMMQICKDKGQWKFD